MRCVVQDCQNDSTDGEFDGDTCQPCADWIRDSFGTHSQAYRNQLKHINAGITLDIPFKAMPVYGCDHCRVHFFVGRLVEHVYHGVRGNAVRVWQTIVGTAADGIAGRNTENATKKWQRGHSIYPSGTAHTTEWAAALHESPGCFQNSPCPDCSRTIRYVGLPMNGRGRMHTNILSAVDVQEQLRIAEHNSKVKLDANRQYGKLGPVPPPQANPKDVGKLALPVENAFLRSRENQNVAQCCICTKATDTFLKGILNLNINMNEPRRVQVGFCSGCIEMMHGEVGRKFKNGVGWVGDVDSDQWATPTDES